MQSAFWLRLSDMHFSPCSVLHVFHVAESLHSLADQCLPLQVREATAAEIAACHGPHHMARVADKSALAAADAMAGGPGKSHFSRDTYVNQQLMLTQLQ